MVGPLLLPVAQAQQLAEMTPDQVNGLFEFFGGCFALLSIRKVIKDKQVHGVSWFHISFFSAWGMWNIYFYPAYGLWWSFWGGLWIVAANTTYVTLLLLYGRDQKGGNDDSRRRRQLGVGR